MLRRFECPRTFNKSFGEVGPFEKQRELSRGKDDIAFKVGVEFGEEATLLEALADEDEAGTIVEEALARGPAGIHEDKQVAREGVLTDLILRSKKQGIVGGPHVGGLLRDEDLGATVEGDHEAFLRKSRATETSLKRMS